MPTAWILHVKQYQQEHNVSYGEAMKKAKASYRKGAGKAGTIQDGRKYKRIGAGTAENVGIALGTAGGLVLAKRLYDAYKIYKNVEKQVNTITNKKGKGRRKKRKGKGVVDTLKNAGKKALDAITGEAGTAIRNAISTNPKSRPLFPGEKHAVELEGKYKGSSYNWMGPGTQVEKRVARGDEGINYWDNVAKRHDIAYTQLTSIKDPEARIQAEIRADMKAIQDWQKQKPYPKEVAIAIASIGGKMAGQLAGKIPYGGSPI